MRGSLTLNPTFNRGTAMIRALGHDELDEFADDAGQGLQGG